MHEIATTRYMMAMALTCLCLLGLAQHSPKWREVIDKDGVQVFTYYSPEMQIRACRAETILSMPMDTLETIFDEVEHYPYWQDQVTDAKVIHRNSDQVYHITSTNDQGFLSRRRNLVWAVEKFWDDRTASLVYDQVCSSNTLETSRGSLHAIQAFVSWRLEPISETEIRLTYMLTVDQNGKPPQWALGLLDPQSGFQTLSNLRDRKYRDEALSALD